MIEAHPVGIDERVDSAQRFHKQFGQVKVESISSYSRSELVFTPQRIRQSDYSVSLIQQVAYDITP
jgi:hypothetical protein